MAFTYPPSANTDAKRFDCLIETRDRMRIIHNLLGDWLRGDLNMGQYVTMPEFIKSRSAYQAVLPRVEYDALIVAWNVRDNSIGELIPTTRAQAFGSDHQAAAAERALAKSRRDHSVDLDSAFGLTSTSVKVRNGA